MAKTDFRVGHGFDVHQLVPDRKLILGGVELAHPLGLLGHSDADVLLHALTDALFGALALGDIGTWFPDSDPANKDLDSSIFLKRAASEIAQRGWGLCNCDCVLMAQRPKLMDHLPSMRERIATLLEVSIDLIGIKATTTEKLGFVGREEGIAASAVVLLSRV